MARPRVPAIGPHGAKILIVGDFPGADDEMRGEVFQGTAGHELGKMLHEAGILKTECRMTNLLKSRPMSGSAEEVFDFKNKRPIGSTVPDAIRELNMEIAECRPNIVVLLGGLALYAANGSSAINTWRGSLLQINGVKAIPTYHPTQILRNWEWRAIAVADLRRVRKESSISSMPVTNYSFSIRPSANQALATLNILLEIANDFTTTALPVKEKYQGDQRMLALDRGAFQQRIRSRVLAGQLRAQSPSFSLDNLNWTNTRGYAISPQLLTQELREPSALTSGNQQGKYAGQETQYTELLGELQAKSHDLARISNLWENAEGTCQVLWTTLEDDTKRNIRAEAKFMLSVDIETRAGHTACTGIAWSKLDAICLPHMCVERDTGYFDLEEETEIILKMRDLLTHPNVSVVGQNFLYDAQYFAKHWGFVPNLREDTMFMQNILFPGLPKGLDFLASMYCENYTYWKAEGKLWDPRMPEEQLWSYNCKDACYTFEIFENCTKMLEQKQMTSIYRFQMELWWDVLRMMLKGVRIDMQYRKQLSGELLDEISKRETWLSAVCGHPLNPKSPKQMQKFFYDDLKLPVQRQRKGTRGITTDDEALEKLSVLEPLVAPICNTIRELRSLGVFHSTFVCAGLGEDLRMRCSFNPAGTETYRFNSSKDAFDSGTNLQNVPKGDEEEEHAATKLVLPNIRKLFIPDSEHLLFDVDLAGADAQVVAWEADDDILKEVFRKGLKVHAVNAKDIFGGNAGDDGKREPYYSRAKAGCHLTNYGGKARTLAIALGITIHEAELFQRRWFEIHPGIADWHERVEADLNRTRSVRNKFGYSRFYFDRIDGILPQALAWIPQSTVACVTNRQLHAVATQVPDINLLIQVHDSLVGQVHRSKWFINKPKLRDALRVVVPYDDPLVIPSGLKTSLRSWGHVEDEKW